MTSRDTLIARLRGRRFDLLVIGGGIVGAGVARDAAMRGLSVALIEQGDFSGGASSKTSKLIHGGLRYLEHGRVRLVFESLRERSILRTTAPGLVHPLTILLPLYERDTRRPWTVRLGLWLYDLLAAGRAIRPHRMLSARRAIALEPGLRVDGLRAAGVYADCQMDDARLCLANILQASGWSAVCANYVRLRMILKAGGRVCGATAEDLVGGKVFEIQARAVVNASGPWSDTVRRLSDSGAVPRLAPTKGIHLVVPRAAQEALFVQARRDHRMLFILPWGDYSLIGTTESAVSGPLEALRAEANEVDYLLEEANRVLPGSHLNASSIVATFAGARPLLISTQSATQASREHRVETDRYGLISVLGGKYTTYRAMARQAVDAVLRMLGEPADLCLTDQVGLLETVHPVSLEHWRTLTGRVDPDLLARYIARYGAKTLQVLQLIDSEPGLAQPVCPHHEYSQAELVHAVRGELAVTLIDVLARRTRITWSSCQGLDALSTVTDLLRRYAGMSREELDRQAEQYRRYLADGLAFRQSHPAEALTR